MITQENFLLIDNKVKTAIEEAFQHIERKAEGNSYLLLLAGGDYRSDYEDVNNPLKPYVIDNRMDYFKDETRTTFLESFLNHYYSFAGENKKINDNILLLHIELMIYSHLWESKKLLKILRRMAELSDVGIYQWKVDVPEFKKQEYLRKQIKDVFSAQSLQIAEVISHGFHSSLRNAFAHSEYSIDFQNRVIYLHNTKGGEWELDDINFDDWTTRFIYSVLFDHHLHNVFFTKRRNTSIDLFQVRLEVPSSVIVEVEYDRTNDLFRYKQ